MIESEIQQINKEIQTIKDSIEKVYEFLRTDNCRLYAIEEKLGIKEEEKEKQ